MVDTGLIFTIGSVVIVGGYLLKNWKELFGDISLPKLKQNTSNGDTSHKQNNVKRSFEEEQFRKKRLAELKESKAKKEAALNKKIAPLEKEIKDLDIEINLFK